MKAKLTKMLKDQVTLQETRLSRLKEQITITEGMDFNNAEYEVLVVSMWRNEGEPNSVTKVRSSFKKAIKTAIDDFRRKNNRDDWQAYISKVNIWVGDHNLSLPVDYWKKLEKELTKKV